MNDRSNPPTPDPMTISLRGYVPTEEPETTWHASNPNSSAAPSDYVLVFDTETTVNAAQRLRIGTYQVREGSRRLQEGLFCDADALTDANSRSSTTTPTKLLQLMTLEEFVVTVFLEFAFALRGTVVDFNLPFDISRIADQYDSARGKPMKGGFTFRLSPDPRHPRIQVKHLTRTAAMIRFATPIRQLTPRSERKRGLTVEHHRRVFVDVKTLAAALLSASGSSLESLAELLRVPIRKLKTEEHGKPLTEAYIDYARRDVQATWECFKVLRQRFENLGLTATPLHHIYSEASVGKAYLKKTNIRPWREVQWEFPPELTGHILSAYFGGRSEVRTRRVITRVLYCDFASMYPTVCTLMDLWRFVIADGMDWHDDTDRVREFLGNV